MDLGVLGNLISIDKKYNDVHLKLHAEGFGGQRGTDESAWELHVNRDAHFPRHVAFSEMQVLNFSRLFDGSISDRCASENGKESGFCELLQNIGNPRHNTLPNRNCRTTYHKTQHEQVAIRSI